MIVVVNGNLDLTTNHGGSAWSTYVGHGLLLVTGQLTYDPDVTWEGIVLVIGKGLFDGSHSGSGSIDGAMLLHKPTTHSPGTYGPTRRG